MDKSSIFSIHTIKFTVYLLSIRAIVVVFGWNRGRTTQLDAQSSSVLRYVRIHVGGGGVVVVGSGALVATTSRYAARTHEWLFSRISYSLACCMIDISRRLYSPLNNGFRPGHASLAYFFLRGSFGFIISMLLSADLSAIHENDLSKNRSPTIYIIRQQIVNEWTWMKTTLTWLHIRFG